MYESYPTTPEAILIYTVSYTLYVIIGKDGVYREVRNSFFQILYRLKLKPLTLDRIGYFTQLCEYQVVGSPVATGIAPLIRYGVTKFEKKKIWVNFTPHPT